VTDNFSDEGAELSQALMFLNEAIIHPILSSVAGYRSSLIQMGFSSECADEMSLEFNSILMRRVQLIVEGSL